MQSLAVNLSVALNWCKFSPTEAKLLYNQSFALL